MPERLLVGCARGCVMVGVLLAMSDTLLPPLTSSTAWTEASHMRMLAVEKSAWHHLARSPYMWDSRVYI